MQAIRVDKLGNIYIVKIDGEVNVRHADELKAAVMKLLAEKEPLLWNGRN